MNSSEAEAWEEERKSHRNYWIQFFLLLAAAVFVPERYCLLIFLGAIWAMLFEISDRLRVQYHYHRRTAQASELIANRRRYRDEEEELGGVL